MAAVNLVKDSTGVSASLINAGVPASGIVLSSIAFGSDTFVQVGEIGSTTPVFNTVDAGGNASRREIGRDVSATINGASALGRGLDISINSTGLGIEMRLQEAFNTAGSTSFAITGGGAIFQLGAAVESNQQVNFGVNSTAATRLGNGSIGYLTDITSSGSSSLTGGQAARAAKIVAEAVRQVSVIRGRLGAFEKDTLDTNVNQLGITLENLTAAESSIRDLDFAQETSNLTRSQVLVSAGTSILAIANQTPQSVLSLLR
jgi:flagellin